MSAKKIRENNSQTFVDDIKRVRDVLISPRDTSGYFKVTKKEVRKMAEDYEIKYYVTNEIFVVERDVMVIF